MKKTLLLLLLGANICFAQATIQGDPAEPCGPIRPDYWIGRHERIHDQNRDIKSEEEQPRQEAKRLNVALSDSYNFGTNVRVNDNPAGISFETPYSSGGHSIAARGDTVYLVWRSDRNTNSAIYFDKSTDGGNTWGTDVKVNDSNIAAVMPALALGKDGTIYVSWTDWRDGNRHIYFAKSMDGGQTFTSAVRVQPATDDKQAYSSITVNDSGYIYIAYEDYRNIATTAIDIYCSCSTDGGNSFSPSVRVDDCPDSASQNSPSIAVKDSCVYISWADDRTQYINGPKIYFSHSIDRGVSYRPNVLVVDTVGMPIRDEGNSSLAINDSIVYVAWGYGKIRFAKSIDGGQTFIAPNIYLVDAGGSSANQNYPTLTCDDSGGIYCAWEDNRNYVNSATQIYMGFSKNNGDTFSLNYHVDDRPEEDSAWLWTPTICANKSGKVYAAWEDDRNGSPSHLKTDIYTTAGNFTGVEGHPSIVLDIKTTHLRSYPNPFNGPITIEYQTPISGVIDLSIYNISGQLVKRLVSGQVSADKYKAIWNGTDDSGNRIAGGIYLVCLNSNGKTQISKTTFIK